MTPRRPNVHAGVLRAIGSRATPRENLTNRRTFLRQSGILLLLPTVIDPLEEWVRKIFPSAWTEPKTLTLAEWAKRTDPDGKIATIVEILSQTNDVLLDMVWMEGALPPLRTTVRHGLPIISGPMRLL